MREIRTSGSMRGRRKRTTLWRACVLLYGAHAVRDLSQNHSPLVYLPDPESRPYVTGKTERVTRKQVTRPSR
jgi:hypothetical protein